MDQQSPKETSPHPDRESGQAREARIGPMVWVPEIRTRGAADPWAHRKGEPRPLALLWASYLMLAAALTIFAAYNSLHPPSQAQFIYASRALFVMIALGACVLWPMVRLSQQFPARRVRTVLVDAVIIAAPAWIVLMPSPMLTRWSIEIAVALSVSLTAWTVLAGGALALAYRFPSHLGRVICMLLILLGTVVAPLGLVLLRLPSEVLWFSPFTVVFQISASKPAVAPTMTPEEWRTILWPGALGLGALLLAAVLPGHHRPARFAADPIH